MGWLGPVWILALVHIILGLALLHAPEDTFDDGYYQLSALRVRQGEVPYRDFFLNATPGTVYVQSLLQTVAGVHPAVRRTYTFLELTLTLGILAWVAARRGRASSVWLAGIPLVLWSPALVARFAHPNWDVALGSAVALALVSRASGVVSPRARSLVLAGVVAGATFWFKQNLGVGSIAGTAVLALLLGLEGPAARLRDGARGAGLVGLGAAGAVATFGVWLWARGLGADFVECGIRSATLHRGLNPIEEAFAGPAWFVLEPWALVTLGGLVAARLARGRARTALVAGSLVAFAARSVLGAWQAMGGAGDVTPGRLGIGVLLGAGVLAGASALRGEPGSRARAGLWAPFALFVAATCTTGAPVLRQGDRRDTARAAVPRRRDRPRPRGGGSGPRQIPRHGDLRAGLARADGLVRDRGVRGLPLPRAAPGRASRDPRRARAGRGRRRRQLRARARRSRRLPREEPARGRDVCDLPQRRAALPLARPAAPGLPRRRPLPSSRTGSTRTWTTASGACASSS